jgi:hypothetical protein
MLNRKKPRGTIIERLAPLLEEIGMDDRLEAALAKLMRPL